MPRQPPRGFHFCIPARNWSFEDLLLRGRRKEQQGSSQKKYFDKYETILSHHW
ncbi:hypothetical protein QUA89_05265 [Microcoleus sp. F10-B4]|uniref:hypothetical protein n=1 Tax=unclassified Microcoleus TaxID=2642155 RepID=UPI002FD2E0B1